MIEIWAFAPGTRFSVMVRDSCADAEYPATTHEVFGLLRLRGLDVEAFRVSFPSGWMDSCAEEEAFRVRVRAGAGR